MQEDFGPGFDAKRFLTPIPNKNTTVRDGVMWTRGSSGGKYPPMVYLALGYNGLSCQGATKVTMPGIDRLAKEGMRFTDAHTPAAWCSPSR